MPFAGNNQEERMATKSTSVKKAAPPKKAKSAAKAPKAAKVAKTEKRPGLPPRLPLVKVSVTYQIADGTTAEFTIDSAKLRDKDFQLKLEKFISEASDSSVYVASDGQWTPNPKPKD
jgi:hypothetical protein